MKTTNIDCLAPLLAILRSYPALHEVRPAVFHLHGKDFIHFHETPEGICADVRLSKGQIRMSVSTPSEQSELLERLDETLATVDSHAKGRQLGKRNRRDQDV
jgi:hypothetical protein